MAEKPDILIITGTRKGIGRALAEAYLAEGKRVIGCSRQPSDLVHDRYEHYELDVTNERAVVAMVTEVKRRHGTIHALLNNAGVAAMNHSFLTPVQTVDALMRTNLTGTFLCCREVAKVMQAKRYGRIVNFTTVAVPLRVEGEALYSASKAAVEQFTRVFAREMSVFGITCNLVGPSPVMTDLIKNVPREKLDALVQQQAVKRFADAADVKYVVDFFLNDPSGQVTGQTIYLGGVG